MASPEYEYRPLATTDETGVGRASSSSPAKAGLWKRLHVLKLILVIGFVVTIVNLFNYRFDMKFDKLSFLRNNLSQQQQPQAQPPRYLSHSSQRRLLPPTNIDYLCPALDGLIIDGQSLQTYYPPFQSGIALLIEFRTKAIAS